MTKALEMPPLPPMAYLLVDNGHYSRAESHSNNHDTDEVLVKADGLDHCYHKDDQCIHVALPLFFWCVKVNKLDDESVKGENKQCFQHLLYFCIVYFLAPTCLVRFHILPFPTHTHSFSLSLPSPANQELTSISVGSQTSIGHLPL